MMISVIICTYNRAQYITNCLWSVVHSEAPDCDYEIIVVDNNSTDETWDTVSEFAVANSHHNIRLCNEKNQGLVHARNLGIKKAKGDLLFFLDDDAIVETRCLKKLCIYYEQLGFTCMGGKILPWYGTANNAKTPAWFNKSCWGALSFLDRGEKVKRVYHPQFPYGANWAVEKKLFDRYGMLNERMGRCGKSLISNEEHEFMLRLERGGEPIYYVPDAVVFHMLHLDRLKVSYLIRRHFAQGISDQIMFSLIKNYPECRIQIMKRILETGTAPSRCFARMLAQRLDWAIPLLRIAYNIGFFWSILGQRSKSKRVKNGN